MYASCCIALLASCTNPYVDHWNQVVRQEQAALEQAKTIANFDSASLKPFVYDIMVGPDKAINNRVIALLRDAKRSIDFNMYMLTRTDVVDILVEARKKWVAVRVILEKGVYQTPKINNKAYDALVAGGVSVVWADEKRFNFNHAKYIVADDAVMIATGNMTKTTYEKNREFFLFSSDAELRGMLLKVFEADFSNVPLTASFDRLYLSPSDSRTKIEKLLNEAVGSIYFYADSLSDERILSILERRRAEWLDIKICLTKHQGDGDAKLAKRLAAANIPFTQASGPYVHAKSFLVDHVILAIGSINFTQNSLDNNREVGILFRDSPFLPKYLSIWKKDCAFP